MDTSSEGDAIAERLMRIRIVIPFVVASMFVPGCQPPNAEVITQGDLNVPPSPQPWKNSSFKPPRADAEAVVMREQKYASYPLPFHEVLEKHPLLQPELPTSFDADGIPILMPSIQTDEFVSSWELYSKALDARTGGEANLLTLLAFPTEHLEYQHIEYREDFESSSRRGFVVCLINRTGQPIPIETYGSEILMIQEAYADIGGWTPIETREQGRGPAGCGFGLFFCPVPLPANSYWEFAAPEYDGTVRTKIRFRCDVRRQESGQPWSIYSNEFIGRVNPEQFITKPRQ